MRDPIYNEGDVIITHSGNIYRLREKYGRGRWEAVVLSKHERGYIVGIGQCSVKRKLTKKEIFLACL